ncbi:MAG: M56 family metallopeptidase [Acidimicrobiales bacterium]
MSTFALAGLVALVSFAVVPWVVLARRIGGAASPRLLATAHLVVLLGWGALPAAFFWCLGQGLAGISSVASGSLCHGCLGLPGGGWRLAAYGLASAALAPLAWQSWRVAASVRRAELVGLVEHRADQRRQASGGTVWVLPSEDPAAYALGVLRPRAVVTTGLLSILDPLESQAVCEHEAAHVRFGHPRLLLVGAIIARSYGFLSPVRRSWDALGRELEAAADDEAVRIVGTGPLLSALARVGLAQLDAAASFGDPAHIRYRIRRLEGPRHASLRANATVTALAGMLTAVLAWSLCSFLARSPEPAGMVGCALLAGAVGLRPVWAWRASVVQPRSVGLPGGPSSR